MRRTARTVAAVAAAALAATASAQSFNIDLEFTNWGNTPATGAPSSAFPGAANQTGFWNAVATTSTGAVPLLDLASLSTAATLTMTTNAQNGFAHWSFNANANTGDYAKLLNDAHIVNNNPGAAANTYTFSGMTPGVYQIFTYGVRPMPGASSTRIIVPGAQQGALNVVGPMPANSFALGITHNVHTLNLTGNSFSVIVDRDPNINGPGAYVNGFQITRTVPAPGALGLLAAAAGFAFRRRR